MLVPASATSSNGYVPTSAEKKLLKVLTNPDFYGETVTEICREAGVGRDAYYRAFKKPEFVALYDELLKEMVKSMSGEVLKATYRFAVSGPKNNADRRLLLEMAQAFIPRHVTEHTGKDGGPIEFNTSRVADLSDEEIEELLQKEVK